MFQVLKGSSNDVEVAVRDPTTNVIVKKYETPHETIELTALMDGDYSFCFQNRFPPMSPKRIFLELRGDESLNEEAGLPESGPSTMIESLAESIHEHLSVSESYQTELRAKLTADRIFAHELLSHISVWSTAVSIIIVVTVVAQVSILKSFFKDRDRPFTAHNSY
ncbi:Transmembrane emp24 domain-containing protein 7 [Echinococcus granulosus]|nr:Transmembrane emp24 domain-containing protein 7 [Echinococcus granulosus]